MEGRQTPSLPPRAGSLDGKVIVLLEDDELIRRATGRMLNRFGATVVSGVSLEEVLAEIQEKDLTPSCVIADYWLGRQESGLAAAIAVRDASTEAVLGLIITGDLSQEIADEVTGAGFRLLRKPVNVDSFLDAITAGN